MDEVNDMDDSLDDLWRHIYQTETGELVRGKKIIKFMKAHKFYTKVCLKLVMIFLYLDIYTL